MHHALLHCCIGFMHAMTDLAISAFETPRHLPPSHTQPTPPPPSLCQPKHQTKRRRPDFREPLHSFYTDTAAVSPCACAVLNQGWNILSVLEASSSHLPLLLLQVNVQQEHSELSELMGDFGLDNAKGKGVAADHAIEQQFAQSEHDLQQANERVTAVNAAIGELQNLEDFIRTTKPPREEAVTLTEEIVRQLLERLNFLRLNFDVPKQVWVTILLP